MGIQDDAKKLKTILKKNELSKDPNFGKNESILFVKHFLHLTNCLISLQQTVLQNQPNSLTLQLVVRIANF